MLANVLAVNVQGREPGRIGYCDLSGQTITVTCWSPVILNLHGLANDSAPSPLDSVTLPVKPEGRQTPRNKVVGLAYITIGASNGGIVLNVSEGGLCFHAIAPVQQEGTVHFWFLEQNQRIEAEGELAWTDETRKIGGLRFTALPAEARQQVRNWISEAATRLAADQGFAATVPLRAFAAPGAGRPDTKVRSGSPLAVVSTKVKVPRMRGFFGGLAIGLLVSLLVAAAFHLFAHDFGRAQHQPHSGFNRDGCSAAGTSEPTNWRNSGFMPPLFRKAVFGQIPTTY